MLKSTVCLFLFVPAILLARVCYAQPPLSPEHPPPHQEFGLSHKEGERLKEEPVAPRPTPPIKEQYWPNLFPLNAHELNTKKIEALNTANKRVYIMDASLYRGVEEDKGRLLQTVNMALERKVDVKILVRHLESQEEMELYRKGVIKFAPPLKEGLSEYDGEMVIARDGQELLGSRGWLYKRVKASSWQIDIREIEELFRKAWQ